MRKQTETPAGSIPSNASRNLAPPSRAIPRPRLNDRQFSRIARLTCVAATSVGTGLAIYLTFRADSNLASSHLFPLEIAEWLDSHGQLRNLPAYGLLAVPALALGSSRRQRLMAAIVMSVFAVGMEAAQALVPSRWIEIGDVLWSWAGIVLAWMICEGISWARVRLFAARFAPTGHENVETERGAEGLELEGGRAQGLKS